MNVYLLVMLLSFQDGSNFRYEFPLETLDTCLNAQAYAKAHYEHEGELPWLPKIYGEYGYQAWCEEKPE